MKKLGVACTALGFFLLFAVLLFTVVENIGTNPYVYLDLQAENGLPEAAGLTLDELTAMDDQLADYLSGNEMALEATAFNATEKLHMRDVLELFNLLRTVRNILVPVMLLVLGVGLWLARGKHLLSASLMGLGLLALPFVVFGVWAVVDFTSAFEAFHRVLFTNELWILNPDTDLLIQILPERFFSDIAAVIVVRAGVLMGAVPLTIYGVRFGRNFL